VVFVIKNKKKTKMRGGFQTGLSTVCGEGAGTHQPLEHHLWRCTTTQSSALAGSWDVAPTWMLLSFLLRLLRVAAVKNEKYKSSRKPCWKKHRLRTEIKYGFS
jgi:hypothetical protein